MATTSEVMATLSSASVMFDANDPRPGERALADLREGLARWRLAWRLALLARFRRRIPFWV
jgi:hypothetical protein